VPVRDEDRAQVLPVVDDVAHVRDHQVDPEHVLGREHEPAVDGDDVVAVLEEHHVLADLAETAEGDHAQPVVAHLPPRAAAFAALPGPPPARPRPARVPAPLRDAAPRAVPRPRTPRRRARAPAATAVSGSPPRSPGAGSAGAAPLPGGTSARR